MCCDDSYYGSDLRNGSKLNRRYKYKLGEGDPHIMNSLESKVLRCLMSETGLKEEEIREIKKYRVMLSEAAKSGQTSMSGSTSKKLMKTITKELKLPKEHPHCKQMYNKRLVALKEKGFYSSFKYWYMKPIQLTTEDKEYLKKNII